MSNVNDIFGQHLRELCDLLVPVEGARDLSIDGYRLLNDRDVVRPLYPTVEEEKERSGEGASPLDLYEPRVVYLRNVLETILNVVDLEADGKTVAVEGFRLKNPGKWLTRSGGANDILAHAASRCNLGCRFCYNDSSPPALRSGKRDPEDEFQEIKERIKHYVPNGKLNIFPNMGSPSEFLIHPHILKILQDLRRKTDEIFRIPTNGSTLTPEMIRALSGFKPIYLDVSLNSSTSSRRKWLMRDPKPETALNSLPRLGEAGIPFTVVIVPWPFPSIEVMLDDLRKTVLFAAEYDPTLMQICLPGYSRRNSRELAFSSAAVWETLTKICQELRDQIDCPLVIRPGIYEEHTVPDRLNRPTVVGVVKNSPVHRAGVRRGDRLTKINGLPVNSRLQARSLLTVLHQSQLAEANITVERKGETLDFDLDLSVFGYPYTPETATHLGTVFSSSGLPRDWLESIKEVVSSRKATEVLLLTSALVRPFLEDLASRSGFPAGVDLHLKVPRNTYFGGNVHMGDLLVVSDFVEAAEEFQIENRIVPDLLVIPSSPFGLSGWGRDLTGRVYLDIERRTGIPTALVECDPVFD